MPSAAFNTVIASRSSDLVLVAEVYAETAVPGVDGFDPTTALACLSSVSGITFRGETYLQKVIKFPSITITEGAKFNSASLTLSNVDRWASTFEFTYGFEGLFLVLRFISRSVSVALTDSYVIFVGRCDKAGDADKRQMPITAKELLGSVDTSLPPRNFTTTDETGRRRNDPLYEGFPFIPALFTISYQTSQPKGGIIGSLLGLKKKVTQTLQASSHSDLDPNKPVPIILGRAQMASQHIGYGDFGNSITTVTAWADGLSHGIHGFANLRNVDSSFTAIQVTALTPQYRFGLLAGTGTGDGINTPMGTAAQLPFSYSGPTDPWPGNGHYSRTAITGCFVNGSQVESDDAAPLLLCIIYGCKMPTCAALTDWSEILFSDNPVDHARLIVTDQYLLNIPDSFIDDAFNLAERQYCDEVLVDEVLTDTLVLPPAESGKAGTDYFHYKSTGGVTSDWYKWLDGDDTVNPFENEAEYLFEARPPIENGGGGGGEDPSNPDPNPDAPTKWRRRFTSNVALTETQKAIDALTNVIFTAARMYVTYSSAGKIRFNVKRPADNTLIRSNISIGATEVPVYSIVPWLTDLGSILIGSDTIDGRSEVRTIASVRYTTAGNAITLTASGGVTASGATFSGGTDTTTPATASLTITSTATKTITIDGHVVIVSLPGSTTATISGLIKDAINSHSILSLYVRATWTPGTAVVNLESKLGFLVLATPLANAHDGPIASPTTAPTLTPGTGGGLAAGDWKVAYAYQTDTGETRISSVATTTVVANGKITVTGITPPVGITVVNWFLSRQESSSTLKFVLSNNGAGHVITVPPLQTGRFAPQLNDTGEECTRMAFVFADRALARSNTTRANIIMDSFKWPLGSRQQPVNQLISKYREAVDDFRPTELRINDSLHQAKVGKKLPFELNLAAVDNYHQAARLTNGKLAELRDADSFAQWSGGAESLLFEVGQVGCVTDFGSGLVNYMVRIEEKKIDWNGIPSVNFIARKYSKVLYADDIYEKIIGMPTTLHLPMLRTEPSAIVPLTGGTVTLTNEQANARFIEFTGVLTSNATVLFPDGVVLPHTIKRSTTGAFTLEVDSITGGTPLPIDPGINSVTQTGLDLILE